MTNIIEALGAILSTPETGTGMVRDALDIFGGRSNLAAALAGTTDKKSNEYKAALKSVERWDRYTQGERGKDVRNPDRMRKATREKLGAALREKKTPAEADIRVRGTVTVSKDTRLRDFTVGVDANDVRVMLTQARQAEAVGDDPIQAAMNVITNAYFERPAGEQPLHVFRYHSDVEVEITPVEQ